MDNRCIYVANNEISHLKQLTFRQNNKIPPCPKDRVVTYYLIFLSHTTKLSYITTKAIVAGSNVSVPSITTGAISGTSLFSPRTNSLPFNFITVARSVSA